MKNLKTKAAIFLVLMGFLVPRVPAQEVGLQWEFNQKGDAEGWEIFHSLADLRVENGILSATVTGDFPQFSGPSFDVNASRFTFIEIRMKAEGASDAIFQWKPDSLLWGFQRFEVRGDSAFHVYDVPVFKNSAWKGHILGMTRLTVTAKRGTRLAIDYIRILRLGAHFQIASFKPLRTVLKTGHAIPIEAVVVNVGDESGSVRVKLALPDVFSLEDGRKEIELGPMAVDQVDTLTWRVSCKTPGKYPITLTLLSPDLDTIATTFHAQVTDVYWRQKEFFLSAWSPPCAWDPPPLQPSHFDYYHQANFDLVLWVVPTLEGVNMSRQFGMHCLLNVSNLLGGDPYLRDPKEKTAPDVTPLLPNLDPVLQQFKGDSTVLGYFIIDEPKVSAFENLGKVVGYFREKDPERLSFINLYPGEANQPAHGASSYNAYIEQFLDVVKPEMLSYDRYIFFKDHDGGSYFSNLFTVRKWALRYDLPFCNIIQAIGTDCCGLNWRTPNENEHRWLVYSSLAYGAKGIIWFHWDGSWGVTGSPDRDQIFDSIQKLNLEIKAIGPEMLRLKSRRVYHTRGTGPNLLPTDDPLILSVSPDANLILGIFKDADGEDFLLVMNKDYTQVKTAQITLRFSVDSLKVFDVFSKRWKSLNFRNTDQGAQFSVSLRAGGGKLIAIGNSTSAHVDEKQSKPLVLTLFPNYPNPFNSGTAIPFRISEMTRVSLQIYSLSGRRVVTLMERNLPAGQYCAHWDGTDEHGIAVASGVYFVRLSAGGRWVNEEKIVYLR